MLLLLIFTLQLNFILTPGYSKCFNRQRSNPKYHLVKKCHRSRVGIVSYANYTSLKSCQQLGTERNGLALNFSPPEAWTSQINYTCEILKCAEVESGLTLINDTRYDYYSLYANLLPEVISTCLPSIGMFYLIKQQLNYTEARTACKNITGVLANVITEQRTDALAQSLAEANIEAAFVGLSRNNSAAFNSEAGDALDCSMFRAWAPGHPHRYIGEFDCMVITKGKTWQTTSCSKQYPSFCEFVPGGRYKKVSTIYPKILNGSTKQPRPAGKGN